MRRFLPIIFLLFCLSLFLSSCNRRPKGVMSKGKMEEVLYDYHLAQAMVYSIPENERSSNQDYMDAVFRKHDITQADFDSSLVWYNMNAEDLKDIYAHLRQKFEEENQELQLKTGNSEMAAAFSQGGDTTNLWTGQRVLVLRNRNLQNLSQFVIKADSSFRPADHFLLFANINIKHEPGLGNDYQLTMSLTLRNKEGKSFSRVETYTQSGSHQLEVSQAVPKDIEEVSGFFYYRGKQGGRNLALIDNIALVRMHMPDDTLSTDALSADSLKADSLKRIAPADSVKKMMPIPLTPDQMQEDSLHEDRIRIRKAPEHRTPNSIGPRRRINNRPAPAKR